MFLDLLLLCLQKVESSKNYSPKWWFDGDKARFTVLAPLYTKHYKPMQNHKKNNITKNTHKSPMPHDFPVDHIGIGNSNPVGSGDVSEFSTAVVSPRGGFGTFETGDFPKGIGAPTTNGSFFDRFDNVTVVVTSSSFEGYTWMSLYSHVLCV